MRGQQGFTLVEMMVSCLLLVIGVGAMVTVIPVGKRRVVASERLVMASGIAERELSKWVARADTENGYNGIVLCDTPTHAAAGGSQVKDPRYWVNSGRFSPVKNYNNPSASIIQGGKSGGQSGEPLVVDATKSSCLPSRSTATEGGHAFTIDRFVSKVDDDCEGDETFADARVTTLGEYLNTLLGGLLNVLNLSLGQALQGLKGAVEGDIALLCTGLDNGRRLTVAVRMNPRGDLVAPLAPVWMSTIVTDPDKGALSVAVG